ncbi:hypothetical protein CC78DRAFT_541314 [Lojkania enalia]|uniref:Uncharacterized protein n=1 Tax=Lojkania enalia TaxID=147567 RepID=A0A9P4KFB4_9PLEO|nr:hypothetical protein CC78DRAFT_541314 [Didymosphaeria enalia]
MHFYQTYAVAQQLPLDSGDSGPAIELVYFYIAISSLPVSQDQETAASSQAILLASMLTARTTDPTENTPSQSSPAIRPKLPTQTPKSIIRPVDRSTALPTQQVCHCLCATASSFAISNISKGGANYRNYLLGVQSVVLDQLYHLHILATGRAFCLRRRAVLGPDGRVLPIHHPDTQVYSINP